MDSQANDSVRFSEYKRIFFFFFLIFWKEITEGKSASSALNSCFIAEGGEGEEKTLARFLLINNENFAKPFQARCRRGAWMQRNLLSAREKLGIQFGGIDRE